MQIEPEKVGEHETESLIVEEASEKDGEPVMRVTEQESESLTVNELETEPLIMEPEAELLAAYDQETDSLQ